MTFRYADRGLSLATLHTRLGWAGFLALLLALAFSGICAMARMNSDQIVAWLLSQGVVGEAETSTLHDMVTKGAAAAAILGLVAAHLIVLRGVFGVYPWTQVQSVAGYLWQALRPVVIPIHNAMYAALQNTSLLAASLFRPVASAASAIIRGIGLAGAAILVYAADVLAASLGCVQAGLSASISHSSKVVALALRKGWAGISIPGAHAEQWLVFVLIRLREMVTVAAHYSRQAVSAVSRPVGLLLYIFIKVVSLGLHWIITVLVYQWRALSAMARLVQSLKRHLERRVTTIMEYAVRVLRRALRYAWKAVCVPLFLAWWCLAFILRNVQLGVLTLLGHLIRALSVGLGLTWRVAFIVTYPIRNGATAAIGGTILVVGLAGRGVAAASRVSA